MFKNKQGEEAMSNKGALDIAKEAEKIYFNENISIKDAVKKAKEERNYGSF